MKKFSVYYSFVQFVYLYCELELWTVCTALCNNSLLCRTKYIANGFSQPGWKFSTSRGNSYVASHPCAFPFKLLVWLVSEMNFNPKGITSGFPYLYFWMWFVFSDYKVITANWLQVDFELFFPELVYWIPKNKLVLLFINLERICRFLSVSNCNWAPVLPTEFQFVAVSFF